MDFLHDLARMDDAAPEPRRPGSGSDSDASGRSPRELPERCAARGLFRWQARLIWPAISAWSACKRVACKPAQAPTLPLPVACQPPCI